MPVNLQKFKPFTDKLGQHVRWKAKWSIDPYYVWMAFTFIAIWCVATLTYRAWHTVELHASAAMNEGRRAIVNITSGETEGTPRHTKREGENAAGSIVTGSATAEAPHGAEALAPAPLDTITEQSDRGLLPAIGKDGTLPWKYYGRPYTPKEQRPMVAIIFTNLGLSKGMTEEVMKLPHDITLSFSPYASDAKFWSRKARGEGFEAMVDLPMEPDNFPISDPGPNGLISTLDPTELISRVQWALSRFQGFVGVTGSMGEKITSNPAVMRTVLAQLSSRGVMMLYQKNKQNVELADFITKQKSLALGTDIVIDDDLAPATIIRQLDALSALAKSQGHAIGIAHAYPPTLRALQVWYDNIQSKGVDVVPLSAIAKKVYP